MGAFMNFGLSIYLARILAKSEFGIYQYLITLLGGIAVLGRFGMDTYLITKIPGERSSRVVNSLIWNSLVGVLLILCIFLIISYFIFIFIQTNSETVTYAKILLLALIPQTLYMLVASIQKARERLHSSVIINNIAPPLFLFIFCYSLKRYFDALDLVTYSYIASSAVTCLIGVWYATHKIKLSTIRKSTSLIKLSFFSSMVFVPHSILAYTMLWVDVLIVGTFLDAKQTADYSVASRVTLVILLAMSVYDGLVAPKIVSWKKNLVHDDFVLKIKKVFLFTTAFITGITMVMVFSSKYLISLFGENYLNAAPIALILSVSYSIRAFSSFPGYILIASGEIAALNKLLAYTLFFNIALNLTLVFKYGVQGVAVGSFVSSLFIVAVSYYAVNRNFRKLATI